MPKEIHDYIIKLPQSTFESFNISILIGNLSIANRVELLPKNYPFAVKTVSVNYSKINFSILFKVTKKLEFATF